MFHRGRCQCLQKRTVIQLCCAPTIRKQLETFPKEACNSAGLVWHPDPLSEYGGQGLEYIPTRTWINGMFNFVPLLKYVWSHKGTSCNTICESNVHTFVPGVVAMAACKICLAALDDRKGDRKSLTSTTALTTTMYSTLAKFLEGILIHTYLGGPDTFVCRACFNKAKRYVETKECLWRNQTQTVVRQNNTFQTIRN